MIWRDGQALCTKKRVSPLGSVANSFPGSAAINVSNQLALRRSWKSIFPEAAPREKVRLLTNSRCEADHSRKLESRRRRGRAETPTLQVRGIRRAFGCAATHRYRYTSSQSCRSGGRRVGVADDREVARRKQSQGKAGRGALLACGPLKPSLNVSTSHGRSAGKYDAELSQVRRNSPAIPTTPVPTSLDVMRRRPRTSSRPRRRLPRPTANRCCDFRTITKVSLSGRRRFRRLTGALFFNGKAFSPSGRSAAMAAFRFWKGAIDVAQSRGAYAEALPGIGKPP